MKIDPPGLYPAVSQLGDDTGLQLQDSPSADVALGTYLKSLCLSFPTSTMATVTGFSEAPLSSVESQDPTVGQEQ